MSHYLSLVHNSDILVYAEYQGHVGKGVYSEIHQAILSNKPIYSLTHKKFVNVNLKIVNSNDWQIYYAKVEIAVGV